MRRGRGDIDVGESSPPEFRVDVTVLCLVVQVVSLSGLGYTSLYTRPVKTVFFMAT